MRVSSAIKDTHGLKQRQTGEDVQQGRAVPGKGLFAWVSQLFITVTNTPRQPASV